MPTANPVPTRQFIPTVNRIPARLWRNNPNCLNRNFWPEDERGRVPGFKQPLPIALGRRDR
jgi:hypothetical protein